MKRIATLLFGSLCFFMVLSGAASAETILNRTVNELIGVKYKYGGTTEEGFDCSGFTSYVFAQFGIELNRSSKDQNKQGYWIPKEDLRPGDLVFFNTDGKGVSHVGIYLGNDEFAHSATNIGVTINKLSEKYYKQRYVSSRRVLWDSLYTQLTTDQTKKTADVADQTNSSEESSAANGSSEQQPDSGPAITDPDSAQEAAISSK